MPNTNLNSITDTPPACGPTLERLQRVLDGGLAFESFDSDPHPAACLTCRERIAATRRLLGELALRTESSVPVGFADRVLAAVHEDRLAQVRRQSYTVAGGVALALLAASLLIAWFANSRPQPIVETAPRNNELSKSEPAPAPHPIRLGDEFAKVGQALRDSSKPITEPAASAPQVVALISDSFKLPPGPGTEFEPARKSLAELPDAALAGLEPVADTTQKAFSRLLRDIGSVGSTRPKS